MSPVGIFTLYRASYTGSQGKTVNSLTVRTIQYKESEFELSIYIGEQFRSDRARRRQESICFTNNTKILYCSN